MKVGIVTTWNERCGVATYSENIVRCLPNVEWRIIGREEWGPSFSNVPNIAAGCDLVHIMHQGGLMASMSTEVVAACGKVVITRQCTGPECVFEAADVKTCHTKTPGYRWVPHGIHVVENVESVSIRGFSIGCCGIPFDGKGHLEAMQIAQMLQVNLNLVIPENPHTSLDLARHIERACQGTSTNLLMVNDWLPEEEVSLFLAQSYVNIFYYSRSANGVSGAVRMGLAAGRPVIVSENSQFADIVETGYVTVAQSVEHAAQLIRDHADGASLVSPRPLLKMWDYYKTSQMYYDIYEEVLSR